MFLSCMIVFHLVFYCLLQALSLAKQTLLIENNSQQVSGVFPFGPEHLEVRDLHAESCFISL